MLKLGSLHPTRDFNYVQDTVNGFIAMAESDKVLGEEVNLGSNYEISIGDTVNLIAEVMGAEVGIQTDDQRLRPEKSEVERLWADNSKALELLDWAPQYANLEGFRRALAETIDWFTEPANLQQYKHGTYNI